MKELMAFEIMLMKCIWSIDGDVSFVELVNEMRNRFGKRWKGTVIHTYLISLEKKKFIYMYRVAENSFIRPLVREESYRKEQLSKIDYKDMEKVICFM